MLPSTPNSFDTNRSPVVMRNPEADRVSLALPTQSCPENTDVSDDVTSSAPEDLIPPPVIVSPADEASPTVESPPLHVEVPVPRFVIVPVAVRFAKLTSPEKSPS